VGILYGFAPWIVYWALVGNAPLLTAALVAFTLAVAGLVAGYLTRTPRRSLEIGSATTFLVITAVTLLAGQPMVLRWALPLSYAGLLLVTVLGRQFATSFVHEYAAANQPPSIVNSDVFGQIASRLTWIWTAVFAGMTVSASIPPVVAADASICDAPGRAGHPNPARLDDGRGRRHRTKDHVRRLPRGHHRRAVLPGPRACQS
jgi:hypothetical protein